MAEAELWEEVLAQTELTFPITTGILPAAARETNFSEQRLYTQLLIESPLFEPFASAYEVLNLDLVCSLSSENPDCAVLQGFVTLRSRENDTQMSLTVKFEGSEMTEIKVDRSGI